MPMRKKFASAAVIAAVAAALPVAPAWSGITISGVGVIVKSHRGAFAVIAPTAADGTVHLTGLEPGNYAARVMGGAQEATVSVSDAGQLKLRASDQTTRADARAPDPRARRALPLVRLQVEQIAITAPRPGGALPTIALDPAGATELNRATAAELAQATGMAMQAAVQIVTLRDKAGPYVSVEQFARRNCPTTTITMTRGAIRLGNTVIMMPVRASSQVPGFHCQPRDGSQFSLYGRKHRYVGHVTLLR